MRTGTSATRETVSQAWSPVLTAAGVEGQELGRQILAEKQAAQISLRTDVGMLASTLAERIVGEQLSDTALSERVIDRFLDELETMEPVEGLDTGASSSAEATR